MENNTYHDLKGNAVNYDENGVPYSTDRYTGEIIELTPVYMRPGDVAYSKESREARKQRLERERQLEIISKANHNHEKFIFANTAEEFSKLSPISVVRLIVLSTYSGYDSVLRLDTRTPMVL